MASYLIVVLQKFSDRSESHVARSIVGISVYTRGDTGKGLIIKIYDSVICDSIIVILYLTDGISIRICD